MTETKILTRDNVGKRIRLDNSEFLFDVAAKRVWEEIIEVTGCKVDSGFIDIASFWLCNQKKKILFRNVITTPVGAMVDMETKQ